MRTMSRPIPVAGLVPMLVVGGSFLAGGILGCLFGALASGEGASQLQQYLNDYVRLAGEGQVSWSAVGVLWDHGRWLLACVLLSMTAFGVVVLPVLFGVRGFLLAFGVSCFMRFFGGVGLLSALLLFGAPALLWAPGLFLVGVQGFSGSLRLVRRRLGDQTAASGVSVAFRSSVVLGLILLVLCVILECSLLPVLLPSAARFLG